MVSEQKRRPIPSAYKAIFSALLTALFLSEQALAVEPTGCSSTTPGKYLTDLGNSYNAAVGTGGGSALGATEASTAQVLEVVAQRRTQDDLICPAGFTRADGTCRRTSQVSASKPKQKLGGSSASRGRVVSETARMPSPPEIAPERNSVWSEAIYDYDRRTGLGDGTGASASRTQRTVGFLTGFDHLVQLDSGSSVIVGAFGGYSETRQDFSSQLKQALDTHYQIVAPFGTFDYFLPADHTLTTQASQDLRGGSFGSSLSLSTGGFFSDSVAKVDIFNLTRTTVTADTFASTLKPTYGIQGSLAGTQVGCIETRANTGQTAPQPAPYYTLTNPTTTTAPALFQQTAAYNVIVAENLGYHFGLGGGYWVEPLVGARYTFSTYGSNAADLGLQDGHAVRVQGGARVGNTSFRPEGYLLTTAFTGLLYSDVMIRGFVTNTDGFSAGFLAADEGKLRVQGIVSAKLDFMNGFSAFVECQGRGGNNYYGVMARIGGGYHW